MKRILWGLIIAAFALAPGFCFGLVYKVASGLAYTDLGAGELAAGSKVSLYRPGQNAPYAEAVVAQVASDYAAFAAQQAQVGDRVRAQAGRPAADELLFVYLTDPHFGSARGTKTSQQIISELKAGALEPAFALVGGDLTDNGKSEQFRESLALRALPFPVYPVPGNHDLRWAEGGKELYRKWWGDAYYAFQAGAYEFIALDSSIRMEQYGHIEAEQLKWLAKELQAGSPEKIVFLHHPIVRTSNSGQPMVDNEAEVLKLLSGGKIRLLLAGHLHTYQFQKANGVFSVVSPAAMNGEYLIVNLSGRRTTIFGKKVGGELRLLNSFTPEAEEELKVLSPAQGARWQAAIPIRLLIPGASQGTLQVAVDGKRELSVSLEAQGKEIPWQTNLLGDWVAGWHTLSLRYQTATGYWQEQRSFFFQPEKASPSLSWEFQAKGDLQAGPAASPDALLVTTLNGWVQCLSKQEGKLLWERQLGSPLVGGAKWGKDAFYLGSEAGSFFSFTEKGQLRWSLVLDGSVLSRPETAGNLVLVGAGAKLVALEAQTGKLRWQNDLGGLLEASPLVAGNIVYAASWEGSIAAFRLLDGKKLWSRKLDLGIYAPGSAVPALVGGALLISGPRKVWGLNPDDGAVLWQLEEKLLYAPLNTTVGGLLVAGTLNRKLIGVDGKGTKLAELDVADFFTGPGPVGGGGEAYQIALGGTLYRLWREAGLKARPLLRVGDGFILGDPYFDGARLYFASLDGKVAVWNLNAERR